MKWEYKLQKVAIGSGGFLAELATNALNELGDEGWEAVSWWHTESSRLDGEGNDTLVLFKRPAPK